MTSDVTILVGCYRQEDYLPHALQSALDQVRPFGCDADEMPTFVVESFIDTKGIGASAARNKAIREMVHTPWVLILDADDLLPSHYLYHLWLYRDFLSFVGAPVQFISGLRLDRLFNTEYDGDSFEVHCPCATISGLFRLQAWQDVGGFDENLVALNDWDFWLRLVRAGYIYQHCLETFVLRRGNVPGSITAKGMSSVERTKQILDAFNTKHGTQLKQYPQGYTIPFRGIK